MNIIKKVFLFLIASTFLNIGLSQIQNGAIFHIIGGNKLQGELLSTDSVYRIKLLDESVYDIKKNSVTKAYHPDEITLFTNGKFNQTKGFSLYFLIGAAANHSSVDMYGGYQFGNGIEAGLGIGFHTNTFNIPVFNNNFGFYSINSYPLYASGKYYFLKKKLLRPYAKLLVGINNNSPTWEVAQTSNGLLLETGLGIAFSGKKNSRFFMEVLQYNTKVKGTISQWNFNGNPNGVGSHSQVDFNLWINHVLLKFGVFFNIGGGHKASPTPIKRFTY